jgi:hypothetical protein
MTANLAIGSSRIVPPDDWKDPMPLRAREWI